MDSRSGPLQTGGEGDENTLREDGISLIFDRRTVLLAGLGLAGACASTRWTPPVPGAFRVVEHQPIEVRDGVRLSARLWLPEGAARAPAVLECVPYRKRDLYRGADDLWGPQLAAAGIAFVRLEQWRGGHARHFVGRDQRTAGGGAPAACPARHHADGNLRPALH
ncbi:MAG: hypothetical protein B7Z38_02215 [Rhodobacterales bacterium 12-64-8]|nr:MAG: hypothetical protein B7Z38_02215 [Rhodobacterales bacterium 12-64-8]